MRERERELARSSSQSKRLDKSHPRRRLVAGTGLQKSDGELPSTCERPTLTPSDDHHPLCLFTLSLSLSLPLFTESTTLVHNFFLLLFFILFYTFSFQQLPSFQLVELFARESQPCKLELFPFLVPRTTGCLRVDGGGKIEPSRLLKKAKKEKLEGKSSVYDQTLVRASNGDML